MRFAYADPPYLGMCKRYDHEHGDGGCWDDEATHRALIDRLVAEYDGWALSLSTVSLATILPMCPRQTRVMAWCKQNAAALANVRPVYGWEPVLLVRAAGRRYRRMPLVMDWALIPAVFGGAFLGAKPPAFTHWMLTALDVRPGDDFHDLFPGSGAVTKAYEQWVRQAPLGLTA